MSHHPASLLGATSRRLADSGPFAVPALANLKLWLKADAITGLSDGDVIDTWPDSSGLGHDAVSSFSQRPIYRIIGGRPVVRFNGLYHYMVGSVTIADPALSVFAVSTVNNGAAAYGRLISLGTYGVNDYDREDSAAALLRNNTNAQVCGYRNNSPLSTQAISYGVPSCVISVFDGTNHTTTVDGTAGPSSPSTGTFGISGFALGNQTRPDSSFFDGDLTEVIVCGGAFGAAEITGLRTYSQIKYGTP